MKWLDVDANAGINYLDLAKKSRTEQTDHPRMPSAADTTVAVAAVAGRRGRSAAVRSGRSSRAALCPRARAPVPTEARGRPKATCMREQPYYASMAANCASHSKAHCTATNANPTSLPASMSLVTSILSWSVSSPLNKSSAVPWLRQVRSSSSSGRIGLR